jgi:GTP-binding protein
VNKAEGLNGDVAAAEFYELGFGRPQVISAAHGQGVGDLLASTLATFGESEQEEKQEEQHPRVAIVGRPNVGKSTLTNALLGEERVIAHDEPGTTRDSIQVEFEYEGSRYTLIDTAGIRRKGKVFEAVEKFSVIKTLQSIESANVVILVLDGSEGVSEQDAHIAGFVLERGRALVVAVNKWDVTDEYHRDLTKRATARKLRFLSYSKFHYISAAKREGIKPLLASVRRAYNSAICSLSTPRLTRALLGAVSRQQPPRDGLGRPKLRFAHQGGRNPPIIIVHGSALHAIPASYRRYLEASFREVFELEGTPLRVEFRGGQNPYTRDRA